jgi:hypothetical protein
MLLRLSYGHSLLLTVQQLASHSVFEQKARDFNIAPPKHRLTTPVTITQYQLYGEGGGPSAG